MKVFIVSGGTGEYSDYVEWIVCAYLSEEKAKARVVELELLMKSLGAVTDAEWEEREKAAEEMRKHPNGDGSFDIDYTGTRYSYQGTELKDWTGESK